MIVTLTKINTKSRMVKYKIPESTNRFDFLVTYTRAEFECMFGANWKSMIGQLFEFDEVTGDIRVIKSNDSEVSQ